MEKEVNENLKNEEVKVSEEVCETVKEDLEESITEEFKEKHELDEEAFDDLISGLLAESSEVDDSSEGSNERVEKKKIDTKAMGLKIKSFFMAIGSVIHQFLVLIIKKLDVSKSLQAQEIIVRLKMLPKSNEGRMQIGKLVLGIMSMVIVVNLALTRPNIQGFDSSSHGVYDTADNKVVERITASREDITKSNLIRFFDTWIKSSAADTFIIDLDDGFGLIFEDTTSGQFQYNQVQVVAFEEVVDNVLLSGYDTLWMTENPYTEARIENGDIIYDGIEIFQ